MGDIDSGDLWFGALSDLYPNQLMIGISKCSNSGEAWPPSAPEFKAMCLPDPKDYGLPGAEEAYREATDHSHHIYRHKWSHPIVYQCGAEVTWFAIRTGTSKTEVAATKKLFIQAYQRLCERVMSGEAFSVPVMSENALEHHQSGDKVVTTECREAAAKALKELKGLV